MFTLGVLSLPRTLYHRLRAAIELWRAGPVPILVYQMGKVGSTSVCDALSAAGLKPLQVHVLGKNAASSRQRFVDEGQPLPYRKHLERRIAAYLEQGSARVKIITLVRDPIARAVSGSYQTAWRHSHDATDATAMRAMVTKRLSRPNALAYCYRWFEEEIADVLDIDVMASPFDPELGYQEISGPRADLLILKLERLDQLWPVIGSFVGREVTSVHSNVRAQSASGRSYRQVQQAIALPRGTVLAHYDHPWMRHFYSDSEIAAFVEKWGERTGNRPEPPGQPAL